MNYKMYRYNLNTEMVYHNQDKHINNLEKYAPNFWKSQGDFIKNYVVCSDRGNVVCSEENIPEDKTDIIAIFCIKKVPGVYSDRKMVKNLQISEIFTGNCIEKFPILAGVMESAYEKWQSEIGETWSYYDFLMNLSPVERRCVIMGNLNYQVTNGGFAQWVGNGYFSPKTQDLISDAFLYFKSPVVDRVSLIVIAIENILEDEYEYVRGDYSDINRNIYDDEEESFYGDDFEHQRLDEDYYKINEDFLYSIEKKLRIEHV